MPAAAFPARVVLATGNRGKLREFAELLAPLALEVRPQSEFGIDPPQETGTTFVANALIKARNAARLARMPAIADDSGIEVDALDGAPGVYSARFAGPNATDAENLAKLQRAMQGVPLGQRGARYRCVIAFVQSADDTVPVLAEGVWEGRLVDTPAGGGGFGYDPIFVPHGEERTVAELPAELKHQHSHRGQALRGLLQALRAQYAR
jgi:XTP/dITP diphosphohydrolase